jgi:Hemocyanin, ig-like domain
LRDPMFYVFSKRITFFYDAFVAKMPKYKFDDLNYDGVKIESVNIDKLMTYFDYYYASIGNAIDIPLETKEKADMKKHYRVQVPRLNHSPFTVSVKVTSTKAQKSIMAMFVGPKYDSFGNVYNFNTNRNNFWQLDRWIVDLKEGDNEFVRKSTDFSWFVSDTTSSFEVYKQLMTASNGGEKFKLDNKEAHCGFPERLMLPRGRVGGFPVQFFFMVYPYVAPKTAQFSGYDEAISCGVGSGARYLNDKPFGYPFDRLKDYLLNTTPNMFFYDTFIYHKANNDIMHVY